MWRVVPVGACLCALMMCVCVCLRNVHYNVLKCRCRRIKKEVKKVASCLLWCADV